MSGFVKQLTCTFLNRVDSRGETSENKSGNYFLCFSLKILNSGRNISEGIA